MELSLQRQEAGEQPGDPIALGGLGYLEDIRKPKCYAELRNEEIPILKQQKWGGQITLC